MTGINYHPLSPQPFPPRNHCLLSIIQVNSTSWLQKSHLLRTCLQTRQTKPRPFPADRCSTEVSRPGGTCAHGSGEHESPVTQSSPPVAVAVWVVSPCSPAPLGLRETDSILRPCRRSCRVSCGCYHNSTVHNPLLFHVTLAAQNSVCLFSPDNSCYSIPATGLLFTLAKRG